MQKRMLRDMLLIRKFELRLKELFSQGKIPGFIHLYVGEEAIAVGVCSNLKQTDYVLSTHRGHGHCIAKGVDLKLIMAEVLGRETGCCKGKGGSMHIADLKTGILSSVGIVGSGLPLAVGAGLAAKLRKSDQVTVCFFGDGAVDQGTFHESLNLASLWKLPVVFVCENNLYFESTHISRHLSARKIKDFADAYRMPGETVDGNDVTAVYEASHAAIQRARKGKGPTLLECMTYRWGGHSESDPWTTYRTVKEVEEWKKRCPIERYQANLIQEGILTSKEADNITDQVDLLIEEAVKFAEESAWPNPEEALVTYSQSQVYKDRPIHSKMRKLTFREAIREAMMQEMRNDETIFLMGEDVQLFYGGGPFAVTKEMVREFGEERIRDTPISESAFVGAGVGAALSGMRPIVELMFVDFFGVCMDQIYNQAAKLRYMSGGQVKVPLVIRTTIGAGLSCAAQHSQCLYSIFAHVPGLIVAVPSTPFDAKGLLVSAIRADDPVVFLEHKLLYDITGQVPEEAYVIPFGKADVKKEGKDVTIVAVAAMVHKALAAAYKLEEEGISAEVIDPRTIVPLDKEIILKSVRKTSRLVIVDEDYEKCGFAAEVAAIVADEIISYLDSPIKRITTPNVSIPFSPILENYILPNEKAIIQTVRELLS